jgi:hypothetical protein
MARQSGAEVLATRTRDLQRGREGQFPAGQAMVGQHVVAQTEGGRVRIRAQIETTKRRGVKPRRKIRIEGREPKLLILYLSDRKGRMLRGTRPRIDGTMNGPGCHSPLQWQSLYRGLCPCNRIRQSTTIGVSGHRP